MLKIITLNIPGMATVRLSSYVLFASVGLLFSMLIVYHRINRIESISFKKFLYLIGFEGVGIVVGSKLMYILTQIPAMMDDFSVDNILHIIVTSGFVFYGGLLGALLCLYIYSRLFKVPYKQLSNVVAPAFPMFHMWGRIGCAFAGCCYGVVSDWGIILEDDPGVKHLPVQFIESGILLLIFLILILVEKKNADKSHLMQIYLVMYAASRFVLEFFRGDSIRGVWFGVSTSQWISICIVIVLVTLFARNGKRL